MSEPVNQLREIIARLRAPDGCPWDREQTAETLRTSLLEEAYEVIDAIERGHQEDLKEELGDLLINIMMQAQIASERDHFTFDAIAGTAAEKLVRRHPHVFATANAESSAEVLAQWEEIKLEERRAKEGREKEFRVQLDAHEVNAESQLDGVARAFPALLRAQKIQKKAAKVGFDWESPGDVLKKVREEISEVEVELRLNPGGILRDSPERERLTEELGDLFFAVVNLSRVLSIDAESALQAATDKFSRRFRSMESEAQRVNQGQKFSDLSFEEMNALWDAAKSREKSAGTLP